MALTGRADRQKVLQYVFVHESILERDKFSAKGGWQIQDTLSYSHAGAEFFRIERLGDVIVRSRVQTGNDVSHGIPGGQQNNVSSRSLGRAAYFAAELGTAKTGIGLLSGGLRESSLRAAGCIAIYRDPADLLANYETSPLASRVPALR